MKLLPPPLPAIILDPIVRLALSEDLGRAGDLTTDATIAPETQLSVVIAARQPGVMAGAVGRAWAGLDIIQPAAGDAGGALGAALCVWYGYLNNTRLTNTEGDSQFASLLGPSFSDNEAKNALKKFNSVYTHLEGDEVYNKDSNEKGVAEVIIGKQRNGPIGTVRLAFQGQFSRFDDLAPEYYAQLASMDE